MASLAYKPRLLELIKGRRFRKVETASSAFASPRQLPSANPFYFCTNVYGGPPIRIVLVAVNKAVPEVRLTVAVLTVCVTVSVFKIDGVVKSVLAVTVCVTGKVTVTVPEFVIVTVVLVVREVSVKENVTVVGITVVGFTTKMVLVVAAVSVKFGISVVNVVVEVTDTVEKRVTVVIPVNGENVVLTWMIVLVVDVVTVARIVGVLTNTICVVSKKEKRVIVVSVVKLRVRVELVVVMLTLSTVLVKVVVVVVMLVIVEVVRITTARVT